MKLYVSDLDGTLLNKHGKLSSYSIQTINSLVENGVNFTIATARAYESVKVIVEPLKLKLPVILNNGSFIYDFCQKKNIDAKYIPAAIGKKIIEKLEMYGVKPFVSVEEKNKRNIFYKTISNPAEDEFVNRRLNTEIQRFLKVDHYHLLNKKIINIFTLGRKENLKKIANELSKKYSLQVNLFYDIYNNAHWLEINPKLATKGNAVLKLIKTYNFTHVSVFGDNLNDISMFKISTEGYAVKNAHKDLKKYATAIIGSNNRDSVVRYIEKDYKRKINRMKVV